MNDLCRSLLAQLIELRGRTAGTLRLRSIANDLTVGLDVLVDVPMVSTNRGNNLLQGERIGWELELADERNGLGLLDATTRSRGGSCAGGGIRRGGVINFDDVFYCC